MTTCVITLKKQEIAYELVQKLLSSKTPLSRKDLVKPIGEAFLEKQEQSSQIEFNNLLEPVLFNSIELLNPGLARKKRQKLLSLWLMPFGFIAGMAFTQMTKLHTFSNIGIPVQLETLFGGLLGMGSGWIGSFFSSGSVNEDIDDDLRTITKKSNEGFWLLILQTPFETELPWEIIKTFEVNEIITINSY